MVVPHPFGCQLGLVMFLSQFPFCGFFLSSQKECLVEEFYSNDGVNGNWSLFWRRTLFQWELDLLGSLKELLEPVRLSSVEDFWRWLPNTDGTFSINSSYNYLVKELRYSEGLDFEAAEVFKQLWESPTPSKVIAFSWQLLYDRFPSRSNLIYRGILAPDAPRDCVGCVGVVESSNHIFFHCSNTFFLVWNAIFRWIGVVVVIPPNSSVLFEVIRGAAKSNKDRQGFLMIWHATLWTIWKTRNNIFSNGSIDSTVMVDEIKVLSWRWSLATTKMSPCLFYDWTWDPGDCLSR
ncbi:uncharacterized protein LOC123895841 [Trifolium pratense]|uniref:uncharacterized protein LOC123895841 n=1 Tax=Trifolium pratense TaxID=57577 RepID=UPI001E6938EA|nr:uncharacterized protein LOC123895841 [Trifolium pratense]